MKLRMLKLRPGGRSFPAAAWLVCFCLFPSTSVFATDFFLTIGGGYEPQGNQASLEANVLFFEEVLRTEHRGSRTQATFFADGNDPQPDLQVLTASRKSHDSEIVEQGPVVKLLQQLYASPGNAEAIDYRNHRIGNVSGSNSPASIHASLQHMCREMVDGDRLIVYVTAHGGEADGPNKYNTTISCWDDQSISAREFETWLDEVPVTVPVIMVMAQCYCGGFAHTIFDKVQRREGLATGIRVGFFAQQHNLPAAGCRPDIENDEEYSSFFWGAFVGRSRNGRDMPSADFDNDGRISFAEAHAHAMLTSETIDIPLRSSDALLRAYSRIYGYEHSRNQDDSQPDDRNAELDSDSASDGDGNKGSSSESSVAEERWRDQPPLASMVGSIQELIQGAAPELQQTVRGLAQQLEIELQDDVTQVFDRFEEQRDASRQLRRTSWRGRRRGGSGRRQLREEISNKWPELSADQWHAAAILRDADQSQLLEQIAELPNYERFTENARNREQSGQAMAKAELREVKFQRLVNTLEAVVLARNLERVVDHEVVERYKAMLELERSPLSAASK